MDRCPYCSFCPTSDSDCCDRHSRTRNNEWLAREFHRIYEKLAPEYGYKTRTDTRDFDPKSKNGKLMIAVVEALRRSIGLRHD